MFKLTFFSPHHLKDEVAQSKTRSRETYKSSAVVVSPPKTTEISGALYHTYQVPVFSDSIWINAFHY